MKGCKVYFKPRQEHIDEIKAWLVEEDKVSRSGFFCNWSSIAESFSDGKLAVLVFAGKAIGFMSWFEWEKVARIQLAEIRPSNRKQGFGRYLAEALFFKLLKKGFAVLDLHCQPAGSKKVWKRLGFKRFPEAADFKLENAEEGPYLYKVLVPSLKPARFSSSKEAIELWHAEPHLALDISPQMRWHPKFEKGSRDLLSLIISPAKRD